MSHKATNWLSEVPPEMLGSSEFRVLFHLCDCHNPSQGCFPTQAYLRVRAGVSNGTVNNVLNSLEVKGLIQRHRTRNGRTKRQNPTRYILGFEIGKGAKPTPKSGAGKTPDPSPKSGAGADSNLDPDPTPIQTPTRLQPTGEEPVSNQKLTSARARENGKSKFSEAVRDEARKLVKWLENGGDVSTTGQVPQALKDCAVAEKMIEADRLAHLLAPPQRRRAK